MKRRDFIANSSLATFSFLTYSHFFPGLPGGLNTAAASGLEFFTADEFQTITELCDRIIPTDYSSPGAVEASVNFFIDKFIAFSEQKSKDDIRKGLIELDNYTQKLFNNPFHKLTEQNQIVVLKAISKNEDKPVSELEEAEKFFVIIKRLIYDSYYRTATGIHMEIKYKGNGYYQKFSGCR